MSRNRRRYRDHLEGVSSNILKSHPLPDSPETQENEFISDIPSSECYFDLSIAIESQFNDAEGYENDYCFQRNDSISSSSQNGSFDRQLADSVSQSFNEINAKLYEGIDLDSMSPELKTECEDWIEKFPHLRILGKKCEIHPLDDSTICRESSVDGDFEEIIEINESKDIKEDVQQKSDEVLHEGPQQKLFNRIMINLFKEMCCQVAQRLQSQLNLVDEDEINSSSVLSTYSSNSKINPTRSMSKPVNSQNRDSEVNLDGILQVKSKLLQHRVNQSATSTLRTSYTQSSINVPYDEIAKLNLLPTPSTSHSLPVLTPKVKAFPSLHTQPDTVKLQKGDNRKLLRNLPSVVDDMHTSRNRFRENSKNISERPKASSGKNIWSFPAIRKK